MPENLRTKGDMQHMCILLKDVAFFRERNMNEKNLFEVVACMKLLYVHGGQNVMEYGDVGDNFYFILKG